MTPRRRNSIASDNKAAKVVALFVGLLVSAFLMAVALRSQTGGLLAWFTLVPLFLAVRLLAPGRAFLGGAFWGLCLFLFCACSPDAPVGRTLPALALLTLVPGIYAWAGARLTRQVGFSPLLLALGWIGVELVFQPLGLKNGLLAGTQGHGIVVRTLGYLSGYVVVAFIVAYVNASLLSMLSDACVVVDSRRRVPRSSGAENRLIPIDLPVHFLRLLSLSQPRAPPE